ncbi:YveK family protein [Butyrivibrio sp. FC2001]|uniref:YveK family protein n=1 Tax=Butyrivibrio sp. FC2001 TaxID=1280671 RepID=UPI0003F5960B|nr:hypothetical protein [Butyrivibrio sp. FC2001]
MKYTKVVGFEDIKVSLIMVWKNISKCFYAALAFFAIGIILTLNQGIDNTYTATTNLYCTISGDMTEASNNVQIFSAYASLIKSNRVAERAVSIMGNTNISARYVQSMITYTPSANGINLELRATSTNSKEAVEVVNAVASAFVEEMRMMTNSDAVRVLNVATDAYMSGNGVTSLWKRRIVLFVLGFAFMAVFIFTKELFSDKLRSIDQCLLTDDDIILGIIPKIEEPNEK